MLSLQFTVEGEVRAIKAPLPGDTPAVFFFSVHKAGSTMFDGAVRLLAEAAQRPTLDVEQQCFDLGLTQKQWPPEIGALFNLDGYLHISFRGLPPNISYPMLARRKKVLLVRNPLDCMVSYYFSVAKSHVLPDEGQMREWILAQRADASGDTLENYISSGKAAFIAGNLRKYIENLLPQGSTKIYRYEDIIFSKREWLLDMAAYCEIPCEPQTLERILGEIDVQPAKEDAAKHIRRVAPGQHKELLLPETIAYFRSVYADVFEYFGY